MRRKARSALGKAAAVTAIAGCIAGMSCPRGGGALAQMSSPDLSAAFATPSTAKADKLGAGAPARGDAARRDALPATPARNVPATLPPRVESILGTPFMPRSAPAEPDKSAAAVRAAGMMERQATQPASAALPQLARPAAAPPAPLSAASPAARSGGLPQLAGPATAPPSAMPAASPDARPGGLPQLAGPAAAPPAALSAVPPDARPGGLPQAEEQAGEIMWSNKTAALPGTMNDAGPPRLNPGNRAMDLAVPLRDGPFYLGELGARIWPDNAVSLAKERLVQIAAPLLRTPALDIIKAMPDSDGYLPLSALREKGFDLRFDPAKVELQFSPAVEQRSTGKLSAGNRRETVRSENLSAPAIFAGYLNMRAGADYSSRPFLDEQGTASARTAFDGAVRWSDMVFESAATFDMEDGFTRGASRLVYDMPDRALRFSAGDVSPLKADLQGGSDLLGLSIEKSYQKLQPGANIRPTGSRSFRIERPSKVDVTVNGHVVQRLHLRPGDYDLSDLPLAAGANDIALVIEDDVGQKRTLDFTVFSGRTLLAPGISEWALSAGVASRYGPGKLSRARSFYSDLDYDFATPVMTGFYERGLTPDVTGNVHLQAAPSGVMGGTGAAFQTSFGLWAADAAVSQSRDLDLGYAGGLGYDLSTPQGGDGIARSFRLAADYRSARFAAADVFAPYNQTMLDVSAVYSQTLPWDMAGSVSGSYFVGRGDCADRYGVDISVTRSFGPSLSAGLSAGFGQTLGDSHGGGDPAENGFTAALRLSYRVDEKSSIDAGHDLRGGRSQVAYRHQEGSGVGSWNTQVELEHTGTPGTRDAGDYGVNGSLGYIANRAEIALSQHTGLNGLNTTSADQRTSVTAGTAIAFADGRFAVGRPVSNGFAIVGAHDNLPGSDVTIGGSQEARQGASDLLGPALVSQMSPYAPARVSYDVNNLPTGYDLGAGTFDLHPAYKSGYRLTVGSDYTITAFGTLTDDKGEPIALLTGTAEEEGITDGHKVTVFTNRMGRFGAQGLRPGRWLLDMATEPKTRFVIDIPKGTVGFVKLDTLRPEPEKAAR